MLSYLQNKRSKKRETGYGDYTGYDYFREVKDIN